MKGHILIVDDQPGIRLLLTDVFASEGYEITTAKDGQEALDKIQQYSFDLIMLDDGLPILSGRELLQKMKEEKINTRVILMSGLIENLQEELAKDDLLIDIIEKPFDIKDICKRVKSILVDVC